jgi:hypothetical protein
VEEYGTARQTTDGNRAQKICKDTDTIRICKTDPFPTATMVTPMPSVLRYKNIVCLFLILKRDIPVVLQSRWVIQYTVSSQNTTFIIALS